MQFGPVLGGSLSVINLRLPLFVSAAIAFVVLLLLIKYFVEPEVITTSPKGCGRQDGSASNPTTSDSKGSLGCTRALILLLSSSAMFTVSAMPICLPILLADKFNLDPNEIGACPFSTGTCVHIACVPCYSLRVLFERLRLSPCRYWRIPNSEMHSRSSNGLFELHVCISRRAFFRM